MLIKVSFAYFKLIPYSINTSASSNDVSYLIYLMKVLVLVLIAVGNESKWKSRSITAWLNCHEEQHMTLT